MVTYLPGHPVQVNNARAMAGSAAAQLVFSGDEHGRVKVRPALLITIMRMLCMVGDIFGRCAVQSCLHIYGSPTPCIALLLLQVWKWKAIGPGGFPIA